MISQVAPVKRIVGLYYFILMFPSLKSDWHLEKIGDCLEMNGPDERWPVVWILASWKTWRNGWLEIDKFVFVCRRSVFLRKKIMNDIIMFFGIILYTFGILWIITVIYVGVRCQSLASFGFRWNSPVRRGDIFLFVCTLGRYFCIRLYLARNFSIVTWRQPTFLPRVAISIS